MTRIDGTYNQKYYKLGIERLLPRHFKIVELVVAGHDPKVIAEMLGMTHRAVNLVQRSPLFQTEVARRRKELQEAEVLGLDRQAMLGKARSILDQATEKAAKTVELIMDTAVDQSLKLKAADSILDRVFGKKGEAGAGGVVVNISAEQIQLLTLALKESNHARLPTANRQAQGSDANEHRDVQEVPQIGTEPQNGSRGVLEEAPRIGNNEPSAN